MGLFSSGRRRSHRLTSKSKAGKSNAGLQRSRREFGAVAFEQLEDRSMLTILSMNVDGLQSDNSIQAPAGKDLMVPIVATDDGNDGITYSVTSSNSNVTVTPVSGSTYLTMNVSGTDNTNTPYSGTLTFKLFDSLTPNTVATIQNLVSSGTFNNTTFARVLNTLGNLLVAQGGFTSTGGNNGTGQQFPDEFNTKLNFDSQGVLAYANAGPDTNDVEFFVTGVDEPGTSTPLTQSDLAATRFLDNRFTIFGQLVDGLSTFNKIMNSTLTTNTATGEDSLPNPLINISSASIVNNTQDTVLDISVAPNTAGQSATISITATEANGAMAENAFTVNVVANTIIDAPFLGAVQSLVSTTENTPVTFTIPSVNPDGATMAFQIVDPTTGQAPANVTIGAINPTTGQVTLTPNNNFTGSISLLAALNSPNADNTSFDTQPSTLTVNSPATPNGPTNLTATPLATNDVHLTWTAPTSTITGYNIFRGTTAGGESTTPINSTPLAATATSFDDLTATAGGTFFYTVEAVDGSSPSAASNEASATTPTTGVTVPGAPTNLTASAASTTEIDLSWVAGTGTITGYNIFRGTTVGGESTTPLNSSPLSSSATSFQDTTVTAGTTYFYVVKAVDSTVSSASSNEATATATLQPGAPTLLTPTAVSQTEIDLAWTAGTGTVTGYNVFRGTTAGGESTTPLNSSPLSSSTTTFHDTTATAGTTFFYVVKAINGTGSSSSSNEQAATAASTTAPGAPTLNTPTVVSQTEIDLAWTAGSGTVTGYNVFRGTTAGGESTTPLNSTPLSSSTTTFQDTTATAGTTFFYVVKAINANGTSPSSNEQSATAANGSGPAAPTGLALDSTSQTGLVTGDNFTSQATPLVDATAAAGSTVTFSVNGKTVTATANSSGLAQATLSAGTLAVGANTITATASNSSGSSTTSSPLTVTYAPSYLQVYTVPGAIGSAQTLTLTWTTRHAAFNDEIGVYEVSDAGGTVNGLAPGAAGYDKAAIGGTSAGGQFQQVVFATGANAGATMTLNVTGGELLAFYMIQNNSTANFLSKNPTDAGNKNSSSSQPTAFFTTTAANPDGSSHAKVVADSTTGTAQYAWEDEDTVAGSDKDYNDVVMTVALSSGQTADPGTLHAPDTTGNVKLSGTLDSGTHDSTAPGDVGVYFVDNPSGSIGSLTPGSAGYLAAALASGNMQVLIPSGTAAGAAAQSITVPAGKYLAFFAISSGTTANFLSANPTNGTTTSGLPNAFLSFPAANPNQINHFTFTSPEGVATDPTKTQLHIMDQVMGSATNFNDLELDLSFAAGS